MRCVLECSAQRASSRLKDWSFTPPSTTPSTATPSHLPLHPANVQSRSDGELGSCRYRGVKRDQPDPFNSLHRNMTMLVRRVGQRPSAKRVRWRRGLRRLWMAYLAAGSRCCARNAGLGYNSCGNPGLRAGIVPMGSGSELDGFSGKRCSRKSVRIQALPARTPELAVPWNAR